MDKTIPRFVIIFSQPFLLIIFLPGDENLNASFAAKEKGLAGSRRR